MRIIIEKHFNEGIMKKNYEFWREEPLNQKGNWWILNKRPLIQ